MPSSILLCSTLRLCSIWCANQLDRRIPFKFYGICVLSGAHSVFMMLKSRQGTTVHCCFAQKLIIAFHKKIIIFLHKETICKHDTSTTNMSLA